MRVSDMQWLHNTHEALREGIVEISKMTELEDMRPLVRE